MSGSDEAPRRRRPFRLADRRQRHVLDDHFAGSRVAALSQGRLAVARNSRVERVLHAFGDRVCNELVDVMVRQTLVRLAELPGSAEETRSYGCHFSPDDAFLALADLPPSLDFLRRRFGGRIARARQVRGASGAVEPAPKRIGRLSKSAKSTLSSQSLPPAQADDALDLCRLHPLFRRSDDEPDGGGSEGAADGAGGTADERECSRHFAESVGARRRRRQLRGEATT